MSDFKLNFSLKTLLMIHNFLSAIQTRGRVHIRGCRHERLRTHQLQGRLDLLSDEEGQRTAKNAGNLR